MWITKFSAAFAAAIGVVPRAFARTETRLPNAGVGAARAGARRYTPLVTSIGQEHGCGLARAAAGRRALARVQPLAVRHFPVTPLRSALFANS